MNFSVARHNMVESQIRTNRVTDRRLIEALDAVPLEAFLPGELGAVAYSDGEISIGGGRSIPEPMVFARMVQAAAIGQDDVVLDVGCATGYSSAVLARLATTVVALESDPALVERAGILLAQQGAVNVAVAVAALEKGDPAHGPYDVIMVEGAVPKLPEALLGQLAEGGRLVAVVGDGAGMGRVVVAQRNGQAISRHVVFDAAAPSLPGFEAPAGFAF